MYFIRIIGHYYLSVLCSISLLSFLLWCGCDKKFAPSSQPSTTKTAKQLLETPLYELLPSPQTPKLGNHAFQLPPLQMLHIQDQESPKDIANYRLYRQDKNKWWVVYYSSQDRQDIHELVSSAPDQVLQSLKNLTLSTKNDFSSHLAKTQLSLFSHNNRFLLRILDTPLATKASHTLEKSNAPTDKRIWLIYYHGSLYTQPNEAEISIYVPKLLAILKVLRQRSGWLQLPINSESMPIARALELAKFFHKQRQTLRRCFGKRQFPASIGPLKILLTYAEDGTLKNRHIETNEHKKHNVVWCPYWHIKQWKLSPPPGHTVEYRLIIPPQGP
jgi:hypothetical protein